MRQHLPEHWRPNFDFAFSAGLRPGEMIGLKPEDIDWSNGVLYGPRAITLDEKGGRITGDTRNEYSRRRIELTPVMLEALTAQEKIHDRLGSEYFFWTPQGCPVHLSNLRRKVWIPALKAAEIPFRAIKQTRHTSATQAQYDNERSFSLSSASG